MKEGIHPKYKPVVFRDASTGYQFLTRSTIRTEKTVTWDDGTEYPLVTLEISSSSHPFYTGTQRLLDTAGRVERYKQRYGGATEPEATATDAATAEAPAEEAPADEAPAEAEADEAEAEDGGE